MAYHHLAIPKVIILPPSKCFLFLSQRGLKPKRRCIKFISICDQFYNVPTYHTQRATSFGFGNRVSLVRLKDNVPPPNSYRRVSDFEQIQKKAHIYSFGASREVYKKVYQEHNPSKEACVPGPGTYGSKSYMGHDSTQYSMRPKTNNTFNSGVNDAPGPGAYNSVTEFTPLGKHFISKYKSAHTCRFNPPHSSRFETKVNEKSLFPGPGKYNMLPSITPNGIHFLSKFKSALAQRFGKGGRLFIEQRSGNKLIRYTRPRNLH